MYGMLINRAGISCEPDGSLGKVVEMIITSAKEVVFVGLCLSVSKITQKVMD